MLIFKKGIKLIIFIISIFIINFILCFILETDLKDIKLKKMWNDLKKEKDINTLFIGSSIAQVAFDPYLLDEQLKIKSFNMGSGSQSLQQTYIGINEILKQHKIKTIVLGMGHFTLVQENKINSDMIFINSKEDEFWKKRKEQAKYCLTKEHIKNTESINFLFPWIYTNCGFSPKKIIKNLKIKTNIIDKEKLEESNSIFYIGKGFFSNKKTHDYNKVGDEVSDKIYPKEIFSYNFDMLKKIVALCKSNGIELIVINPVSPIYDVLSYGNEYFFTMYKLKEFFKDLEVPYYDFNLIKPNIFQSEEDYFYDHEHLNQKGSTEFSKSFANFMKLREKNKNMDEYFYTPEEYLASIKHISIVNFDIEKEKEGINIVAKAYTGSKVKVEYEILIYDDTNNEYKIIREYNENPKYFYSIIKNKKYKIRVNTRQVGTNIPYERYYEKEVEIKDY